MNIPPKYEDVVAKLDAALGREAALREELNQARATGKSYMEMSEALQQRLTVAEQRADDLEADAARYRWLRKTEDWEKACESLGGDYRFVSSGTGMGNSSGECLDAEIDALMQASEGEGS